MLENRVQSQACLNFIFAGCYDNDPWFLVANLAGHLDLAGHLELAGYYFSKCPAQFVAALWTI